MEELIDRILLVLENAGIRSQAAMPSKLIARLKMPMTAVSISRAKAAEQGLGRYLGSKDDLQTGLRELYGCALEATVTFRVASPVALGGGRCFRETVRLMDVLLAGIDGIDIGTFSLEPCHYDPQTDQFVCTVQAEIRAQMLLEHTVGDDVMVRDVTVRLR